MTVIKFLGALIIMGFIIDLFTKRRKNKIEIQKIKAKLCECTEALQILSEETALQSKKVEQETNKLLVEIDRFKTSTASSMKCCDDLIASFEDIATKITILAEAFDNPDMNDSDKLRNTRTFVELIRKDIDKNIASHKSYINNQEWGLGYGR